MANEAGQKPLQNEIPKKINIMDLKRSNYVPRVNQLDSIQLNKEIHRLLRDELFSPLQALSPTIFAKFQPELDLIFNSSIWFGSIGRTLTTFGQQMLLITYSSDEMTKIKLSLHFLLTIFPIYLKSNIEQRFFNKEFLQKLLEYTENIVLILSILNFFRFLKNGKKPTLLDYLLGLDFISLKGNQSREMGYKYLTRELLWGGFMELLGLILPMINYHKMRRIFRNLFNPPQRSIGQETVKFDINTLCTFCGDRPTLPHHMGCGHVFCYYCLKGNILTDENFSCPLCGSRTNGEIYELGNLNKR